jgi:hypothetical protein
MLPQLFPERICSFLGRLPFCHQRERISRSYTAPVAAVIGDREFGSAPA